MTLLELNKAINDKIKQALVDTEFSQVDIIAEDVSEPIIRPSLKTSIEISTTGILNPRSKDRTVTARVYFFASDRYKYKIENAKMQEILENAILNGIEVENGFYPVDDVTSETVDTVLVVSFELYAVELLPEPTVNGIGEPLENMGTLEINLVKE